jgi:hypothetical protein
LQLRGLLAVGATEEDPIDVHPPGGAGLRQELAPEALQEQVDQRGHRPGRRLSQDEVAGAHTAAATAHDDLGAFHPPQVFRQAHYRLSVLSYDATNFRVLIL